LQLTSQRLPVSRFDSCRLVPYSAQEDIGLSLGNIFALIFVAFGYLHTKSEYEISISFSHDNQWLS